MKRIIRFPFCTFAATHTPLSQIRPQYSVLALARYSKVGNAKTKEASSEMMLTSPYYGLGVIVIDACTAHSGMVRTRRSTRSASCFRTMRCCRIRFPFLRRRK